MMNPLDDLKNAKVSREQLEKAEAGFREAIEQQLDVLEDTVSKWGRTLLVASGTALLGFGIAQIIIKSRSGNDEDTEEVPQKEEAASSENVPVFEKLASPIVQQIKDQMALFLASLVKQKLMEFLERINRLEDAAEAEIEVSDPEQQSTEE